jgi:Tfp pilus assembly protein FimT
MRTCSAPIRNRGRADRSEGVVPSHRKTAPRVCPRAFVLVEMIVVVSILALLVVMVQPNLFGTLRHGRFKSDVQGFISAMQMAASTAAESNRRYEMIIDLSEQTYLLRQITSSDLSQVLDEEIILDGQFGENARIAYVEFDDGTYTNEGKAKFRVGHKGWHYGGKVVFLDESEQSHSVLVSRITPIVELVDGDPAMMTPKGKDEVPFL